MKTVDENVLSWDAGVAEGMHRENVRLRKVAKQYIASRLSQKNAQLRELCRRLFGEDWDR